MNPFGLSILFLLAAAPYGACDYIYDYFPLDHQTQPISAENLSLDYVTPRDNKFISTLDWDPERDIPLLPLKEEMLLILFNLGLCQHYHNHLQFLCPSTCLGRLKGSLLDEDALPSENGNPCELQRNTRTPACESVPKGKFSQRFSKNLCYQLVTIYL
ncbi:unnamed protein product [Dicrocoelium dendriticum]|nr:unnamed protein product [Dicrocoelium dendriticum]